MAASGKQGIHVRSSSRGRLRVGVAAMVSDPLLAAAVEEEVGAGEPVTSAQANPTTGSLLIAYRPEYPASAMLADTRAAVARSQERVREAGFQSPARPKPGALARMIEVSGNRPGDLVAPAILSVTAYSLNQLQNLAYASVVLVATGGTPSLMDKLGITQEDQEIRWLTAAAAGLTAGRMVSNYFRRKAWRRMAQSREHQLRTALFRHLEELDLGFLEDLGTAQLTGLFVSDIPQVARLLEEGDGLIESVLTIGLAGAALIAVSPWLALIAGVSIPLMFTPTRLLRSRIQPAFAERAAVNADLSQTLENVLAGIVEVKSFTAEQIEADRLDELSRRLAELSVDTTAYPSLASALGGAIYYAGYTPALGYAAGRVVDKVMSQERFALSTFWYPQLVGALGRIQDLGELYYGARTSAERICTVLDAQPRIRSGPTLLRASEVRGEIVVDGVTFGYEASRPVLRDISFRIGPGETLGIAGPTGSGKSTLLRLILRFYDPDQGRILLDGHDLRELDLKELRAAIALVNQEVYLFKGTVAHNVAYGHPSADPEAIAAALRAAAAPQMLTALPDGVETEVGERGHRLSGGQRQRVAIARALLKDAPILALDEATSQLDAATEAAVRASLAAGGRRTQLVVAHRLASLRHADTIVVLSDGAVREQGTHQELLGHHGLYADLWHLQE